MAPHDSSSWKGYKDVSRSFRKVFGFIYPSNLSCFDFIGSLSVYTIVFENDNGQNMMTNESNWCHEFNDIRSGLHSY